MAHDSFDLKKNRLLSAPKGISPKKFAPLTACNRLPSKKVCKIDDLQLASLKKVALSTAYNQLTLKRLRRLRLTISFPQKVFAVYGLQSAYLKK